MGAISRIWAESDKESIETTGDNDLDPFSAENHGGERIPWYTEET